MKNLVMTVEIPKLSANKYEFDSNTASWKLDRVLYGAMTYPEEYGFLPDTLDYDGDPLDIVCLTTYPTFPGCKIPVRILGVLKMIDQGELDYKIIAVNAVDNRLSHINILEEIGSGKLAEISNFFLRYKEIEGKDVTVVGYEDQATAYKVIAECVNLFEDFRLLPVSQDSKQQLTNFLRLAYKKRTEN